jgi:predicted DNA binding CopG/RHH family protein
MMNVAIRVPVALHDAAKRRAAAEDLTLSQVIRRLLRLYIDSRQRQDDDAEP